MDQLHALLRHAVVVDLLPSHRHALIELSPEDRARRKEFAMICWLSSIVVFTLFDVTDSL